MEKKIIPYGTERPVTVGSSDAKMIFVVGDDDNEGYFLIGHGIKDLPKSGDKGKIVFEKGGPMKGYWQYYPNKLDSKP